MAAASTPSKSKARSSSAAAPAAASKSARQMSVGACADLLGIDRGTLAKDAKTIPDFPVVRRSSGPGKGNEWIVDIADVVAFKLAARFDAGFAKGKADRPVSSDGSGSLLDPDTALTLATKQVKLTEARFRAAQNEVLAECWRRGYGVIRQSVMPIADKFVEHIPGHLNEAEIQELHATLKDLCIDALIEGNRGVEEEMGEMKIAVSAAA